MPARLLKHTARTAARQLSTAAEQRPTPPHLLSLADLTVPQIQGLITTAANYKRQCKSVLRQPSGNTQALDAITGRPLANKTIALMFSKRSTRTRVSNESAITLLGGHPMFLGSADIQLGVNESLHDTAKIVSSMTDGIMARVNDHSEVELLAKYSEVPVINALCSLYHPTQILADLLTLVEVYGDQSASLDCLKGRKIAWVGDSNNILNDMIVSFDRLGIDLAIATPKKYPLDKSVVKIAEDGVKAQGGSGKRTYTNIPEEACRDADVVVTDTWISMGQEAEKAQRLLDFAGYQVTKDLMKKAGAKEDWRFMHCLPRKAEEVDDAVFHDSERSLVFQEGENRKWTSMAVFSHYFGAWEP